MPYYQNYWYFFTPCFPYNALISVFRHIIGTYLDGLQASAVATPNKLALEALGVDTDPVIRQDHLL